MNTQNSFSILNFAGCHGVGRGVLTLLFELREEVKISDDLDDWMHDLQWLAQLAHLADVLRTLSRLNQYLHGRAVTIFNAQDRTKAARRKKDLWCARLDREGF